MPLFLNHRGRSVVCFASICAVTLILATTSALALPAGNTIVVNSTLDVANSTDGLCTLREAITAANTDTASGETAGECGAGSSSDSDTINLTGVTGTITLGSALPNITSGVSLNGPGASHLTISGNNSFRVFTLMVSSPGVVSFSGLTIANGRITENSGGGIYNQNSGNVNVSDSTIRNNSAFSGVGGGIANASIGTLTITNSTISNNSAHTGGGCYSGLGTMNIISSTINNNRAEAFLLSNPVGTGGGISTGSKKLNIINSTLHGNSASAFGGAIYNSTDAITNISQSTISQNTAGFSGGGVYNNNGAQIKILNTIVANNSSFGNSPDLQGPFVSLGHNLLTDIAGSSGFTVGLNNPNGDLVGASFAPLSSLLGPLQNNGGATLTRALLPGSFAIDAGDNCVVLEGGCLTTPLTTDQRGISRQVNQKVDIGAFESRAFTLSIDSGTPQSKPVNTPLDPLVVTVNSASGDPVAGGLVVFSPPQLEPSAFIEAGRNLVFLDANGQGSANFTASSIAGGPYQITATINRTAISVSFTLTNLQAASTTTVTSSANPSDLTQSVTFTATVTSTGRPTGFVQFKIDGTNFGSLVPLNVKAVATISTAALAAGSYSISADYSGDSDFTPSSGSLTGGQIVRPPPSPVLLTEENTNHVIALDSVTQVRDPFPFATVRNFSADQHTRVSLFVWRLGLLPGDTIANVIVKADDGQGTIYTLPVEAMAVLTGPDDVTQLIVRLPDNVIGATRNLGVTVLVHGPISNKAFISVAGP